MPEVGVVFNEKDAAEIIRVIDHQPGRTQTEAPPLPVIGRAIVYSAGGATPRSGTTLGNGTGVLQTITSAYVIGNWTSPGGTTSTITFLNASTSAVAAGYIIVVREEVSGQWLAVFEDC